MSIYLPQMKDPCSSVLKELMRRRLRTEAQRVTDRGSVTIDNMLQVCVADDAEKLRVDTQTATFLQQ